jgi:hypothetical protein
MLIGVIVGLAAGLGLAAAIYLLLPPNVAGPAGLVVVVLGGVALSRYARMHPP